MECQNLFQGVTLFFVTRLVLWRCCQVRLNKHDQKGHAGAKKKGIARIQIFKEWKSSIHRYETKINKEGLKKGRLAFDKTTPNLHPLVNPEDNAMYYNANPEGVSEGYHNRESDVNNAKEFTLAGKSMSLSEAVEKIRSNINQKMWCAEHAFLAIEGDRIVLSLVPESDADQIFAATIGCLYRQLHELPNQKWRRIYENSPASD